MMSEVEDDLTDSLDEDDNPSEGNDEIGDINSEDNSESEENGDVSDDLNHLVPTPKRRNSGLSDQERLDRCRRKKRCVKRKQGARKRLCPPRNEDGLGHHEDKEKSEVPRSPSPRDLPPGSLPGAEEVEDNGLLDPSSNGRMLSPSAVGSVVIITMASLIWAL
jgi:hypothetical protein